MLRNPDARSRALTLTLLATLCLATLAQAADRAAAVRAVVAVGMTVGDMDRSIAFFSDVFGFEKTSDVEVTGPAYDTLWNVPGVRARVVRMRLGREDLELTEFLTPKGRPFPEDSRSNDVWFQHVAIVVSDMDAAYARLRTHGVRAVSSAPQTLPVSNVAAAGIAAFYFRDPDGHNLELIHFPPGKGDARWQQTDGKLFLGIDHTAIAVRDTQASLAFYRDRLGLAVVGESLNVGVEQERLTGVAGARVHITGLRAPGGTPGIEFLEYRAPLDGRHRPPDVRANDLVHWHSTLTVGAIEHVASSLRATGDDGASGEIVTLPRPTLGFTRGVQLDDPDGHALRLVEP